MMSIDVLASQISGKGSLLGCTSVRYAVMNCAMKLLIAVITHAWIVEFTSTEGILGNLFYPAIIKLKQILILIRRARSPLAQIICLSSIAQIRMTSFSDVDVGDRRCRWTTHQQDMHHESKRRKVSIIIATALFDDLLFILIA
jgi:hypothetical protein